MKDSIPLTKFPNDLQVKNSIYSINSNYSCFTYYRSWSLSKRHCVCVCLCLSVCVSMSVCNSMCFSVCVSVSVCNSTLRCSIYTQVPYYALLRWESCYTSWDRRQKIDRGLRTSYNLRQHSFLIIWKRQCDEKTCSWWGKMPQARLNDMMDT